MKRFKKILLYTVGSLIILAGASWAGLTALYRANLDFPLYKNERYFANDAGLEAGAFALGARRVQAAQKQIAEKYGLDPKRVFHAKSHGCLVGQLRLRRDRDEDKNRATYVGMFDPANQQSYNVLVRFSNGVGFAQPDRLPDVRGVAIKVLGVRNSETGKIQNVDFLMTNSPRPFGKDFLEFADFMDEVAKHGPTKGGFAFTTKIDKRGKLVHLKAGKVLTEATGLTNYGVTSLATERFWSGHAYLLGPGLAMKFNMIPTEKDPPSSKVLKKTYDEDNFLAAELNDRVSHHPVKFAFALQLEQKDTASTPIEDNLKEWTEKASPSIPVADLILAQQDPYNQRNDCDQLRFTPGHYHPLHRPLSNMGRGRLFGYEASQLGRKAPESDADEAFYEKLSTSNSAKPIPVQF